MPGLVLVEDAVTDKEPVLVVVLDVVHVLLVFLSVLVVVLAEVFAVLLLFPVLVRIVVVVQVVAVLGEGPAGADPAALLGPCPPVGRPLVLLELQELSSGLTRPLLFVVLLHVGNVDLHRAARDGQRSVLVLLVEDL